MRVFLFSSISSIQDWGYLSQYFELLCEASPGVAIDRLEKEEQCDTGLISLFTAEGSDVLFVGHCYTHILWGLEQLLSYKEYAVQVVWILLKISEKVDSCSTVNTPRNVVSKVFCTWYNVTPLSIDEKIEFAASAIEKYPYFWNILYGEVDHSRACRHYLIHLKTQAS